MKKIKNIAQLKAEQKRLLQRKAELEQVMAYDWRDIKESLKPKNVAGQIFSKCTGEKEKHNGHSSIFSNGVSDMAGKFAKSFAEKFADKVGDWFKK
jgi:hypothetical protein